MPPLAATPPTSVAATCLHRRRWRWRLAAGRVALGLSVTAAGGLAVAAATNVYSSVHDRGAQVYVAAQVGWLLLTTAVADGGEAAAGCPPPVSDSLLAPRGVVPLPHRHRSS